MGRVTFWGMQHGLGITSATAAVAAFLGSDYTVRTLVSQPQWSDFTLERFFGKAISYYNKPLSNISSRGIDALERAARSNKLERDTIKNHALPIERGRLDLLQATEKSDKLHFENATDIINVIFAKAEDYYEAILLDGHSGSNQVVTNQLMSDSDLIVVCLNQNVNVLNKYFDPSKEYWPEALHHVPHILLLTQYDHDSKYKVKNIAAKYKYKGGIFPLSYNTEFRDHLNDGDIRGFFARNKNVNKQHENYMFMKEIQQIAECILDRIEVYAQSKQTERRAL
ncbi:hypothetical protein [Paenibacillus sp.]|jgi:hypothetical protein|uniref:hypothetical protein n=1 Tax=Paenibacillus sp. TaxID=58172 RepID=UPI0028277C28|nr:hypothetical protein [Paenibacillus sp.]MDR0271425.1 hypothetical protein [Paenibacillus sp.]